MVFWTDIYYVFKREFYAVFRDHAVLTFFVALMLGYPVVYTFIYSNEVAREVPVAVVDHSKSTLSREFIRNWDATASVDVVARCEDMEAAKLLMYKKDIYGILEIPSDFSKNVARGEQAHVSLFCDMGALLNYKALLTAGTDVSLAMGKDIQVQGMEYATEITEQIASSPVRIQDVKLFNPQGGFTSFLIPAVLILVVQQSLLLGVGTITGTERDRRRRGLLLPANKHFRRPARVVLGKAFAYLPIYFVMSYWVFFIVPRLFGMTQVGERGELILFLFPFLLACTCDNACQHCLQHYRNRHVHGVLDRFAALDLLRWGNAFLDIRVHVCTVDVYFRYFLAKVGNPGILGMVWKAVPFLVRNRWFRENK